MNKMIVRFLLFLIPLLGYSQRAKLYKDLPIKSYYKNGNIRVVRNFNSGKLLGYKTFYRSGAIQSNYVFNSKGHHDSIANFYYPNGKVKTVWKYKNNIVKKRIDYTLKGEVIKGKKDYKRLRECNDYLSHYRNNLKYTFLRAKLNSNLGFYDEALEDFNFILSKLSPSQIKRSAQRSIYHSMAIDYTYTEDYEKALMYGFKALAIQNDNQAVLNNLGWLLLRIKDYDLALTFLDKCHEINPKNYYAFFNKAKIYLEKGNYQKALGFIEKTILDERSHKLSKKNISEEKTIWATRGEIYYRLGRLEEGIIDLQKALEENPANSYAYRCLALIYIDNNQLNKAYITLLKAEEYKYDKIYETNEVKELLSRYYTSK